jgi:hypothetical protein
MLIAKAEILKLIDDLPERVDVEELLYRLYLREKLEAAEEDVREGLGFRGRFCRSQVDLLDPKGLSSGSNRSSGVCPQ